MGMVDRFKKGDFGTLFLEMLLIVVGVLLAFQVDRWYESRSDERKVQAYLVRLKSDVEEDLKQLTEQEHTFKSRLELTEFLRESLDDANLVKAAPEKFVVALQRAGWRTNFFANRFTFDELTNTGDFALLPADIRRALYDYHQFNANMNQFADTVAGNQLEYYRRFSGLLGVDQLMLRSDEDGEKYSHLLEREVSESEALSAYEAFGNKPSAIDWLPWMKNTHLQALLTNERYQTRAAALLTLLSRESVGVVVNE